MSRSPEDYAVLLFNNLEEPTAEEIKFIICTRKVRLGQNLTVSMH